MLPERALDQKGNFSQQPLRVHIGLLYNKYFFIGSGPEIRLADQKFLVELLSGSQSRIFDLNVLTRDQSGKADHFLCQIRDLHRISHVQNEDFSFLRQRPALKDQVHRLGNGHKIPDDIRMGHCDRPALCDLFPEQRDHAPVASQHISEPDGGIFGL